VRGLRGLGAATVSGIIALTSCVNHAADTVVPEGTGPSPAVATGPEPNWDVPISGAAPIQVAGDASVSFSLITPAGLGPPSGIVATTIEHSPLADREIAWLYKDHPKYSSFVVIERLVDRSATEQEYSELVSQASGCVAMEDGSAECNFGLRSFVTLEAGAKAFVLEGDVTTALHVLADVPLGNKVAFARYGDPAIRRSRS
jgi:hypothetical protein